jgi:23S rRNA (pseudouridine1915-N3)-methyltransferase
MEVRVFWIGKTRLPGVAALTEEYSRRLGHFCEFRAEEIRPTSRKSGAAARGAGSPAGREEAAMLARAAGSHLVVLDPSGQQWDSQEFAGFLKGLREGAKRDVSFCVGGAEGFSPVFRQEADLLLSLSPLTLPHELARVVLLEQIYRAWTLLAHHPYPR